MIDRPSSQWRRTGVKSCLLLRTISDLRMRTAQLLAQLWNTMFRRLHYMHYMCNAGVTCIVTIDT